METVNITPYMFLGGFVQNRNVGRVIAQFEDFVQDGSTSSSLMMWNKNKGQWHHFNLGWTAIALHVAKTGMTALSADGLVFSADSAGTREEKIDVTEQGPAHRGPLTDMCYIGDHLYVAGVKRQVYRLESAGEWTRADKGTLVSLDSQDEAGFQSIHGLDESTLFAVGRGGEIWRCKNREWNKEDSPTNSDLHCVRVVGSGLAYATGKNGTLLRWDGTNWSLIEQDATENDMWGIQDFNDKLYIASDDGLFALENDDSLSSVLTIPGVLPACRNLHANDGVMWSFAPKHVAWTGDGVTWHNVTPGATAVETTDSESEESSCGCGQDHVNPGHIGGAMPTGGGHKV
jgi:hypothetical protein